MAIRNLLNQASTHYSYSLRRGSHFHESWKGVIGVCEKSCLTPPTWAVAHWACDQAIEPCRRKYALGSNLVYGVRYAIGLAQNLHDSVALLHASPGGPLFVAPPITVPPLRGEIDKPIDDGMRVRRAAEHWRGALTHRVLFAGELLLPEHAQVYNAAIGEM